MVGMTIQDDYSLPGSGDELLHTVGGDGVVQRINSRDGTDEDEHDQAHALLSVIGAVEKADAAARKHHQSANRPRWRRFAFGSFKEHTAIIENELGK